MSVRILEGVVHLTATALLLVHETLGFADLVRAVEKDVVFAHLLTHAIWGAMRPAAAMGSYGATG